MFTQNIYNTYFMYQNNICFKYQIFFYVDKLTLNKSSVYVNTVQFSETNITTFKTEIADEEKKINFLRKILDYVTYKSFSKKGKTKLDAY